MPDSAPYIYLLVHFLEVRVDFLNYYSESGDTCHQHNICEHIFLF